MITEFNFQISMKRLDMEKYDEEDKKKPTEADHKAKIISELLKHNKFSQGDLAKLFNCTQQNISNLLNRPYLKENVSKIGSVTPQLQSDNKYNNLQDNKPIVVGEGERDD